MKRAYNTEGKYEYTLYYGPAEDVIPVYKSICRNSNMGVIRSSSRGILIRRLSVYNQICSVFITHDLDKEYTYIDLRGTIATMEIIYYLMGNREG